MKRIFLAIITAAALAASSASAGTWSTSNWVNDASLTLTNSKTYTHAIDFAAGSPLDGQGTTNINGVLFTTEFVSTGSGSGFANHSELAYTYSGTYTPITTTITNSWSLLYTNRSDGFFFGYSGAAGFGPSGTESTKLKTAITGHGSQYTSTADWTLTLSGLQPNTDYLFTFYSAVWDTGGTRYVDLDGQDDGTGNIFRVQQGSGGTNLQVQYTYNTGAGTTFELKGNSKGSMVYAFSNELLVIPEPSALTLVGFGLFGAWVLGRRRRG
jgi:hypothetical protein